MMPMFAPLLAATVDRAERALAPLTDRATAALRARRERDLLASFDAMGDDRLYDLGLSRDAIRCGLSAPREPMAVARACRTAPAGRVNPTRRNLPSERRFATPPRFPRERFLGW